MLKDTARQAVVQRGLRQPPLTVVRLGRFVTRQVADWPKPGLRG